MTDRHPIWQLADELQMDIRNASGKLVALRAHLAQMELPDPTQHDCPRCGPMGFRAQAQLDEHLYVSHDGELPAHYARADELAAAPEANGALRSEIKERAA